TSFATILVMWVNHHVLFGRIRRSDQMFLFLNGFLLLFVAFVPFPTALLAQYLRETDRRPGDAHAAAAVYAGTYVFLAVAFNLLWHYAARGRRLLAHDIPAARIHEITRQYAPGIPVYCVAVALAFVSLPASFGLCLLLALFFAFTGALPERFWKAVVPRR
ncbi:MAG: TMEM175 family protein, partial [Acidobacteriota bacterium]|nr:TMEM175 family protein [Acidobacteriota bacterium]